MNEERAKELQPLIETLTKAIDEAEVNPHELIHVWAFIFAGYTQYMNQTQDLVSQILFQAELRKARRYLKSVEDINIRKN